MKSFPLPHPRPLVYHAPIRPTVTIVRAPNHSRHFIPSCGGALLHHPIIRPKWNMAVSGQDHPDTASNRSSPPDSVSEWMTHCMMSDIPCGPYYKESSTSPDITRHTYTYPLYHVRLNSVISTTSPLLFGTLQILHFHYLMSLRMPTSPFNSTLVRSGRLKNFPILPISGDMSV